MKQCTRCKGWKDKNEFGKASKRKDGLQAYCKKCAKQKTSEYSKSDTGVAARKQYRQTNKYKEYKRISMAEYRKTERGKEIFSRMNKSETGKQRYARQRQTDKYQERHRSDSQKYRENHPEVVKSHNAVGLAIRQGKLPKPTTLMCNCGKTAKHYHHYLGYAPENRLNVIPLCIQCHADQHNNQA